MLSQFLFKGLPIEDLPFCAAFDQAAGIGRQLRLHLTIDLGFLCELCREDLLDRLETFSVLACDFYGGMFFHSLQNHMGKMADFVFTQHGWLNGNGLKLRMPAIE